MRAGEAIRCARCGVTIRRGEPIICRFGAWGHPDCLPLEPRPSSVRPYAPVGAQASPHVAAVPVGHARPPAGGTA